jgi:hypothetical protein
MTAGRPSARRSLAVAAFTSALLAIVAAGGGCEFAIGDTVPYFMCVPGHANVCPSGQVCSPLGNGSQKGQCVTSCLVNPRVCAGNTNACNVLSGLCEASTGDGGMGGDDVSVIDSPGPEADAGDAMTEEEATPPVDTGTDTSGGCPGNVLCTCSGDSSCTSKLCVGQLEVGTGLYQAAGSSNFCSQPCCISADCPGNTVCFATGQGGSYCVNPTWIGRTAGSNSGSLGGANCGTGRDCRSALCSGGHCQDTCCSTGQASSECSGSVTCTFGNFPGANSVDKNYAAYCGSGGSSPGGSSCFQNSDCESYLCAAGPGESSNKCKDACRNSSDCTGSYTCNYVIPPNPPTPTPVLAACFPSQGSLQMGQTCDPANDMCKGFCDSSTNLCTDVCFADSDCSGVSGWRCRDATIAVQGGGMYSILCCGP